MFGPYFPGSYFSGDYFPRGARVPVGPLHVSGFHASGPSVELVGAASLAVTLSAGGAGVRLAGHGGLRVTNLSRGAAGVELVDNDE